MRFESQAAPRPYGIRPDSMGEVPGACPGTDNFWNRTRHPPRDHFAGNPGRYRVIARECDIFHRGRLRFLSPIGCGLRRHMPNSLLILNEIYVYITHSSYSCVCTVQPQFTMLFLLYLLPTVPVTADFGRIAMRSHSPLRIHLELRCCQRTSLS